MTSYLFEDRTTFSSVKSQLLLLVCISSGLSSRFDGKSQFTYVMTPPSISFDELTIRLRCWTAGAVLIARSYSSL